MSKKFLSGINVTGTATLNTVANAGLDTDKFLVLDAAGNVDYRTGDELKIDIGADRVSRVEHQVKLGESMTIGTPVYVPIAQDSGTNMTVLKASNAGEPTSSKTMGLIASSGITNDLVEVVTEGLIEGINTGSATKGDPVWLGVDGALIFGLANKPVAPAHLVFLGIVTRAQSNNGEIFVKVQNGFEFDELHDYSKVGLTNNAVVVYESATSLYKPKTIPTILGYTPVPDSRTITINGTTYDLSANRSWTVSANQNARTEYEFTTDGTTATYSAVYSIGQVDVFYNGSKLASTEFTATNGTSVTLGFTPPSGQVVEVVAWETGGGVTNGRTLTINGVAYDLSANRSWTIDNASLGAQPQLNGTGFVKASGTTISYDNTTYLVASAVSGTTGYIPKFTGTGSIGNSSIQESGAVISMASGITVLRFNDSSANIQYSSNLTIGIPALYTAMSFNSIGNTTIHGTLTGTSATFTNPITIGNYDGQALKLQTATATGSSYIRFYNSAGGAEGYFGLFNNAGTNYMVLDAANRHLSFYSSNKFTFEGSNVSIGTTSITNQISGTEQIVKVYNSNASSLYLESSVRGYALTSTASGNLSVYDYTGAAYRMVINPSGHVLIGQTVASGSTNGIYFRPGIESGFIVTNDVALQLSRFGSSGDIQTFYFGSTRVGKVVVADGVVRFESANNGGISVLANGNIAVGSITSNVYKLNVAGSIKSNRSIYNWYNGAWQGNGTYWHMKTNLWAGGSPNGNTQYTMSYFKGYSYSYSASILEGAVGFHNYSGIIYSYKTTGNLFSNVYVSSDGYVVIVVPSGQGETGITIDWHQHWEYPFIEAVVTAAGLHGTTSGKY